MTEETNISNQQARDGTNVVEPGKPSRLSELIEFLGSMRLAITLLVVIAISSVIGTVLQQNKSFNAYITEFGNFWFEVFDALGLFDVYYSWWFIVIQGFLVVSVSVCVYRYAPVMIREMRENRLSVKLNSLRSFKSSSEWSSQDSEEEAAHKAEEYLQAQGYKVKSKKHDDHTVVAAKQGHWNRLGYIFTHVAILLICLGGLIDGNIGLKVKEFFGQVELNKAGVKVNSKNVLEINDRMSFRGKMDLAEGDTKENSFAIIQYRDGLLFQKLPFSVKLKEFKVFYYSTGMPKTFQSEISVRDHDSGKTFSQKISVNHPLRYRGYAIYQATFGDGGSKLNLQLTPMSPNYGKLLKKDIEVFKAYTLNISDSTAKTIEKKQLEITGFKPINVIPAKKKKLETPDASEMAAAQKEDTRVVRDKKFQNIGSSLTFKIRGADGQAQEYINYGLPRIREGVSYLISDMRAVLNAPPKRYFFPLDKNNSPQRYINFRSEVFDRKEMYTMASQHVKQLGVAKAGKKGAAKVMANALHRLFYVFVKGGQTAVTKEMRKAFPKVTDPAQRKAVEDRFIKTRDFFLNSIASLLKEAYYKSLSKEGFKNNTELTEHDKKFFVFSTQALINSEDYPSPYFVQFTLQKHIESSGLQITRDPGRMVVYGGSLLLVIGIYMMFYVLLKRVWVYVYLDDNKKAQVVFAASCNRPDDVSAEYFEALAEDCKNNLS